MPDPSVCKPFYSHRLLHSLHHGVLSCVVTTHLFDLAGGGKGKTDGAIVLPRSNSDPEPYNPNRVHNAKVFLQVCCKSAFALYIDIQRCL